MKKARGLWLYPLFAVALFAAAVSHAQATNPTPIIGAPGWFSFPAVNDTVSQPVQTGIQNGPFSAESTAVLAVAGAKQVVVKLKVIPAAGDTATVRVGVRVKAIFAASGADSARAATWISPPANTTTASVAGVDTLALTQVIASSTGGRNGEWVITYDSRFYNPSAFRPWSGGAAKTLNLFGNRGEPVPAPFIQVVFRMLGPVGGAKVRLDGQVFIQK